jgi:hypothetical protein
VHRALEDHGARRLAGYAARVTDLASEHCQEYPPNEGATSASTPGAGIRSTRPSGASPTGQSMSCATVPR